VPQQGIGGRRREPRVVDRQIHLPVLDVRGEVGPQPGDEGGVRGRVVQDPAG
jgi:hypothetical protein